MLTGARGVLAILLVTFAVASGTFAVVRLQAEAQQDSQSDTPTLTTEDVPQRQPDGDASGERAIAANEAAAVEQLREQAAAHASYYARFGKYSSPYELINLGYLPKGAGSSRREDPYSFVFYAYGDRGFGIGARPQHYGVTARRSFYIGDDLVVRAVDAEGEAATAADPPIDAPGRPARRPKPVPAPSQPPASVGEFEGEALSAFLDLHNRQQLSRYVRRRFLTAAEIAREHVPPAESLDTSGYRITLSVGPDGATFQAHGVPIEYGRTGIRSFYLDETFQLRGADRGGAPAGRGDPAIRH